MTNEMTLFGWPRGWTLPLDGEPPPDEDLESIRKQGIRDLEVRASWTMLDWKNGGALEKWTRRLQHAGLRVHSLHADFDGGDFTAADSKLRVRSLSRHKRAVDVLHVLGGSLYVVDLMREGEEPPSVAGTWLLRAVRGLSRLSAKCRDKGVSLVVRICLPEGDEGEEIVEWILQHLPDGDVNFSVDLDSEHWRRLMLDGAESRLRQIRRVELDECSKETSRWLRSYRRRLQDARRDSAPPGLWIVKPPSRPRAQPPIHVSRYHVPLRELAE